MNRYALAAVLGLFASTSCDTQNETALPKPKPAQAVKDDTSAPLPEKWPAGALSKAPVTVPMAIYAMPGGKEDVEAAARAVLSKHATQWPLLSVKEREAGTRGVFVDVPPMDTFAPPDPQMLEYFGRGLTPDQVASVQQSHKVVVLWFITSDLSEATAMVAEAQRRAGEVAERSGGLLWDEITRELFSEDAWAERTAHPPTAAPETLSRHFTVHMYRDEAFARVVTLGLSKFGLPELAVEGVTSGDAARMNELVNALAAAMLGSPTIAANATVMVTGPGGTAPLELGVGTHQDGDLAGPLATIRFTGSGSLQSRHAAVLSQVLGAPIDPLLEADADDEALKAASAKAKVELAKLQSSFAEGVPELERLSVKGPFTTDDNGVEWMWVEVTRWEGNTLTGTLMNTPFHVRALRQGATVTVEVSAVFDYIHQHADGTTVGGETNAIIQKQQSAP